MSYSYIKSVFPNFEGSKVYDDRLYNSLSSIGTGLLDDGIPKQIEKFTENLVNRSIINPTKDVIKVEEKENKDNLKFYNIPIPYIYSEQAEYDSSKTIYKNKMENKNHNSINYSKNLQMNSLKENFDNEDNGNKKTECELYFKHMLECEICKRKFIKQYNLDKDKIRQDELMEIGSYMVFGLFIMLLLDTIKQK